MDEYQESNRNENGWTALRSGSNRWLVLAVVVLFGITAVTFAYDYHQKEMLRKLNAETTAANTAMMQMQGQVNTLTAKLNEVKATQAPPPSTTPNVAPVLSTDVIAQSPETPSKPAAKPKRVLPKHRVVRRRPRVDKKYLELQAQLADQQKQLKATQDEVAKNRTDLEGSINSTRDDLNATRDSLNGSIARTHEELVALEKRGERSYFEFDLSKAKEFERVGPLSLSLRKADTKHKHYNLAMIVDDNELQKKNVNLYEPIWVHSETGSDSVQIVVNKIEKNFVHGYISAPKYKPSELAAAGSASVTPVSAKSPANLPNQQQPR
ncbi:MAG: hypothetical protein WCE61_13715 [Candidatus Acidiferrum sp.]